MEVIKDWFYPGSLIRRRRMETRINIYLQGVLFTQNY
jgi:hypothetical protein